MSRKAKIHTLYHNGVEVAHGTVKEIAKQVHLTPSQVYRYKEQKNKDINRERLYAVDLEDGDWALYKGEELLLIGTLEEIAEKRGVKPSTIRFYSTPSYMKRGQTHFKNYYLKEDE